jgi:hypothetical protein
MAVNVMNDADLEETGGLTGINLTAVGKKAGVGKMSGDSASVLATVGSATVGSHTDASAYNSDDEEEAVGMGLAGEEGKAISKLFKDNVDLSAVASAGSRLSMGSAGASPMAAGSTDGNLFSRR